MPYTMSTDGLEEVSQILNDLEERAGGVAAKGLYEGAGVMAQSLDSEAKAVATAPFKWASASRGEMRLPSPEEKAVILTDGSFGIAKFDKSGSEVKTSVGYGQSGYTEMIGKVVPIPKIANAINSGTSFMRKQPFVRKAARKGGKKAVDAIVKSIQKSFNDIMEGKSQ